MQELFSHFDMHKIESSKVRLGAKQMKFLEYLASQKNTMLLPEKIQYKI